VAVSDSKRVPRGIDVEAVAYALRSEYEGTVTVEREDGSKQELPKFGGGLVRVGEGDVDVAQALSDGKGAIVVQADDHTAIDVFDVYPALKRVEVPAKAKPLSRYARLTLETLRHQASLRDLPTSGSRRELERALEAQDAELRGEKPSKDEPAMSEGGEA
jgi:hypothetical protein